MVFYYSKNFKNTKTGKPLTKIILMKIETVEMKNVKT